MKLSFSFSTFSGAVLIALFLGQAHADTVNAPLGLTKVDDKDGVPVTPLTYLNLEPASKEITNAAKKATTPPLPHEKRLLSQDHLQPAVERFTSKGLSVRGTPGNSLVPSLPILETLDNEGDHVNAPGQKRLLYVLKSLQPSEGT